MPLVVSSVQHKTRHYYALDSKGEFCQSLSAECVKNRPAKTDKVVLSTIAYLLATLSAVTEPQALGA